MNVTDRPGRPPLSPQEGWISDGRQVLHFKPLRYDRWSQALEVTLGELIPGEAAPLLKRRKELTREQAMKLWAQKCRAGWRACPPQWIPPQPPRASVKPPHPDRPARMGIPVITPCF
ncbi:MAG: hypothetical protein RLZZ611_971 [Cyanobacteriota bacterium]